MKHLLSIALGLTVVAAAQATPFKIADSGALFDEGTKPVHNTGIKSSTPLSRVDGLWDVSAPIDELPEGGDHHLYRRSNDMIYYTMNGLVMAADDYFAGEVVFYDNGDVYMRNMIPSMFTGSYIKGTYADNKITVQFPQGLCYDDPFYDDEGNLVTDGIWPIFRGDYEITEVWDEEWEEYVGGIEVWVDPDCQTMTFTIADDGTITQDEGGLLGVFTRGEAWYGEAAWNYKYEPFDQKPQTLPDGIVAEDWAFYDTYDGFMTKVAIDGDDIYWSGLYSLLPNSVVKGKIDGEKVYFESPTYIGVDPASSHLAYFAGTETVNNWLNIVKKPRFNYDPVKKEITYPRKNVIVNAGPSKVNLISGYNSPTLHYQGPDTKFNIPKEPTIQWVSEFEYSPMVQMNCWFTVVDIPNVDIDGNLLDRERMWYNFFFDDELFWFDTYDYQLVADSPDVPYTYYDDFNIFYQGTFQHYVYFYWTGFKTMGVQSVFEDENGHVYKSDIAVYRNPLGAVDAASMDQTPVSVVYYDMMGRQTDNPSGLCIRQTTYPDGSVQTAKLIVK